MNTATDHRPMGDSQSLPFQADVARLLHLMVHSIYSDRDIFLRELISNAADACEKLRYEALQNPELLSSGESFRVVVGLDGPGGRLSVEDNGVGMTREELISSLGTIANSGTRAFLDRMSKDAEPAEGEFDGGKAGITADLIGQFGIGFYSAFMAASRVDVLSRRAGSNEAWLWSSDGKGEFTVEEAALEGAPSRGTRVVLHLSESAKSYLEPWKVESVVREHSGAIAVPIFLAIGGSEEKQLTEGSAIWAKSKSELTADQYREFYRELSGHFDEPALTVHWRVEGRQEYTVLAFIPNSKPIDLFDPERKGRSRLYVRRVLIDRHAEILPGWLRFVRLVVDSADLPLNVSREMVQSSPIHQAIKRGIVNRLVQEFVKLAESDPEAWARIWSNFGPVIKEGLYEESDRRDELYKLARFRTSEHADGKRSLKDYVGHLRPNQTAIFYLTGTDAERMASSPQLEGYRARGIEVLLLPDPIDPFWLQTATGYEGKPFKSVAQGEADIRAVPIKEGEQDPSVEATPQVATLLAYMKQTLENEVADVRHSDRLSTSAACLVASDNGLDRRLERMLAEHGRSALTKPVLEVNAAHPLILALSRLCADARDKEVLEDAVWLILDEARVVENELVRDPGAFASRLTRVLTRAAG